jgi:hypothetical protein
MSYKFHYCNYCAKQYDTKDELLNHFLETSVTGCNSTMLEKKKKKKEGQIKFAIISEDVKDLNNLKEGEIALYKSNIIKRINSYLTHIGYYNPITRKMEVK